MIPSRPIPVLLLLLCVGCATVRPEREEMRLQMERARALEAAGNLPEAAQQYAATANRFPGGEWSVLAIRKAAVLYAHPLNPERSDSASLHWFKRLPMDQIAVQERELLQIQISTLERSVAMTEQMGRQRETADSLLVIVHRVTSTAATQSRQIQDLDVQVKKLAEELRQLKEIDVRLSKRKRAH